MLYILLAVLIALWYLGYINVTSFPIPDIKLFDINGIAFYLWDLLILGVVFGLIGVIPSPMKQVVGVLIGLWILVELEFIKLAPTIPLDNILLIAIIVGVIASIFTPKPQSSG